ncbi:hypothetical protein OAF16_00640 [Flavobacteriales bacterium]|nr:hypothetical protein [Flavobacteriales bacterium]
MDKRGFDSLIKDSLSDFSELPKKEVKRAVFGIIFFQNLWVFHKLKLFGSIFLISGVAMSSIYFYNEDSVNEIAAQNDLIIEESVFQNGNQMVDNTPAPNNLIVNSSKNELKKETVSEFSLKDINEPELKISKNNSTDPKPEKTLTIQEIDGLVSENIANDSKETFKSNALEINSGTNSTNDLLNSINKKSSQNINISSLLDVNDELDFVVKSNDQLQVKELNLSELLTKNISLDSLKINSKNIVALHTCSDTLEVNFVPTISQNDYANNKFKRGLTVDAYFSPYNRVDVDNVLDPAFQQYWWDFYKEYDMVNSGLSMGVNLSYNFRNVKINTGFSHSQIFDGKPVYDYYTETDSIFIMSSLGEVSLLSVEYVTGLQVFGQDTTVILYVDPNDTQLLSEINESSNRYNYLKIPLTVGYEFSFNRFSIELNGGVEFSKLVKYSGISYKNGYVDVGIGKTPYYYYNDMVATTYANNLDALKIHNWNYVGNVISRIRITPSFDFYSAFNFQYHNQNIMNEDYLLEKSYTKYGLNIGATYYLNPRLSIKNAELPKFD